MKYLILIILTITIVSCKKEEFNPNLTKEFSIQSNINGANYKIKVALPENYNPSLQKYATIYVLDGEENFSYVASKSQKISQDYSTTNVLVVSIGYGYDREHDYTPTKTGDGGGGAEKFIQFIKDELIPRMENEFGADTIRESRVILGHSFGGLLAAYAYTNFNSVFGNYLMLSPSLWYDNEILLRFEKDNRVNNSVNHQLVYMGLGELESAGRMQAPFEAFYQRLANNYPGIQLTRHIESNLDHMGSKNPNIYEGLKFYFQNK